MLGRDGRAHETVGLGHVLRGFARGDVLEHDLEFGEIAAQRNQLLVDEGRLAVEQVDLAARDFTVHQQQQAGALHGFERRIGLAHVGHAGIAVGRRTRGIQLESHHARGLGAHDFLGRDVVGEVQRHQRLESHAFGHGRENALAVSQGLLGRRDRRLEVGHDDRPTELGGRMRHDGAQGFAVAHMQVPVVGAGDGDVGGGGGHGPLLSTALPLSTTSSLGSRNHQSSQRLKLARPSSATPSKGRPAATVSSPLGGEAA